MLIEKMKVDFEYKDDRGTLTQLIHKGYSQVNVITSKGGIFRGGHYHELNTEAYYVIQGSCKVKAYRDGKETVEVFSAGDFFRIGPYITHDFYYLEDSVLITMYSLGVELEDGKMDSYVPQESNSQCEE